MSKRALTFLSLAASLLAGCATSDDRGAAAGRAIVEAASGIAYAAAWGNCDRLTPVTARDACYSRMRPSEVAARPKLPPKDTFDDLEEYLAKRE